MTGVFSRWKLSSHGTVCCCESRPWLHSPKGEEGQHTHHILCSSLCAVNLCLFVRVRQWTCFRYPQFTKWGGRYNRITRFQHADLRQRRGRPTYSGCTNRGISLFPNPVRCSEQHLGIKSATWKDSIWHLF